jgi:hypothetical protein
MGRKVVQLRMTSDHDVPVLKEGPRELFCRCPSFLRALGVLAVRPVLAHLPSLHNVAPRLCTKTVRLGGNRTGSGSARVGRELKARWLVVNR